MKVNDKVICESDEYTNVKKGSIYTIEKIANKDYMFLNEVVGIVEIKDFQKVD